MGWGNIMEAIISKNKIYGLWRPLQIPKT